MENDAKDPIEELDREIKGARQQAKDHGTLPKHEGEEVEYQAGDPVGVPRKEDEG